jgi:hypothetical protein
MTRTGSVVCYGYEVWAYTHKSKIQKVQMVENRCLTMVGKYSRIANVNLLHADFADLKLDYYFQLLGTNIGVDIDSMR